MSATQSAERLRIVTKIADLRAAVRQARATGATIGLVPTMGALHEAHERLIEQCRREAEFVVVSIFVNPTQFGPGEDFARYPRTLDADHGACARQGAALVFEPAVEEMYPHGMNSTAVHVAGLTEVLEGKSRPGHFQGVATVVLKLLEAALPDIAYFGEKDYQQLMVVRRMASDLLLPVEIRALPTVRAADGLALSSRNRYLNSAERQAATVLSRALEAARQAVAGGERSADRVRQILRKTIESEPLARLDYAEVADAATLEPLETLSAGRKAVALLAVQIGQARLIDNSVLPPAPG